MRPSIVAALALALGQGCAHGGSAGSPAPTPLAADEGWITTGEVSLVPQPAGSDGGAAALAMVLGYWRQPTTVTEVRTAYPALSDSGNTRADDLRAFALDRGFAAFLLRGELEILRHELSEHRPVIVGLIRRAGPGRVEARYQVVVAYNPQRRLIVTLDPGTGWHESTLERFLAEWLPSERLTLVVIPQGPQS